jgi:parvulin-like peptidyl-prolyl isomerase
VVITYCLFAGVAKAQVAATPKPAEGPTPAASKPASPAGQAPEPADKVVLEVGDQQFTKADIDWLIDNLIPQAQRAIAAQGKKSLGDQYSMTIALSEQAHLHRLDQSREFIHKLAFQRQQLEAQIAIEEINEKAKVTPEEVQQYYTAHAADYDEIMVRQFVIRKKAADSKTDPAHAAAPTGLGPAPQEVKTRAEAIRKELAAGTDIKKVTEYFKAPGDVIIDAEPRTVRRGGMRPDMEKVAFGLKDGEVSEPIDVPQALVFFQVTKHSHSDLKDVSADIEKKLRQQKVDASMDAVKKSANVWMDEQYFAERTAAR